MPDDNVVIQPVFEDAAIYRLELSSVGALRMPAGWRCVQADDVVHEYNKVYTNGARTINGFTGFEGKALYWLNNCAEYGRQTDYPLTLEPGTYKLTFAMAAYKGTPNYKASILNAAGSTIATTASLTATPNANGDSKADVSSAESHSLTFTVTEAGNYIISFTDDNEGSGEFLLLECLVESANTTGISQIVRDNNGTTVIFDASGIRRDQLQPGLNIIRTADGKTRKVFVK